MCLTSQIKTEESFLNQKFRAFWYKKIWRNKDRFGEGLMFHFNGKIPSKVSASTSTDIELILLEFTLNS